jgi:light-regulated signal transduction histidine kinase (bacteriophytochrome)
LWKTILSGAEWKKEMCNRKKDGSLCWELQSISPIVDDHGKICNFISLKLDDTRRREAAEKLKEYAIELERSNRELQDFATIASHDLREPLRKIITFGERLNVTLSNKDQQSSEYLQRMKNSAYRMDAFIQDLLKYSQVSRKPHTFESVDLNLAVQGVLEDLELRIAQSHAVIKLERLPTLEADPMQMRQLFANLIGNSIKFHKQGVPPAIRVKSSPDADGRWRIVVEDNGIGFDVKYNDRIFKPFERLHGHNVYEGNGIGLAICRKITDRHKGAIHVHSQPGAGSTFAVLLPAKQSKD